MDADILCTLIAQRIPPEQFQLQGVEIIFFDPNENSKPVGSPSESPYDTPENRAIVEDVIKNYDTLAAEYISQKEAKDAEEAAIKTKEAEILRRLAIAELELEDKSDVGIS